MCWWNRKYHCWRWNFQLLTKCWPTFSEAFTVSIKNHRKHASERDGDKDTAQLTGHWLCRCDLFSLMLRLEYHPLDPLTGIRNPLDAAAGAAAWPERRAAGAAISTCQGAAGELCSHLCTSHHHLRELQHDVDLLSGFKANVSLMLRLLHQGWSWPLLLLLLLRISVIPLKKTFSTNHHGAQETPAERLQDPVFISSHFLTGFINTTCSYIDCHVLRVPTSHRSGHTVPNQLSVLLLLGPHRTGSSDRWSRPPLWQSTD